MFLKQQRRTGKQNFWSAKTFLPEKYSLQGGPKHGPPGKFGNFHPYNLAVKNTNALQIA